MALAQTRHVIGKKIIAFEHNPFPDGRGGTAHRPRIVLDDGSVLFFVTEETDTGDYGVMGDGREFCRDCAASAKPTEGWTVESLARWTAKHVVSLRGEDVEGRTAAIIATSMETISGQRVLERDAAVVSAKMMRNTLCSILDLAEHGDWDAPISVLRGAIVARATAALDKTALRTWRSGIGRPMRWSWFAQRGDLMASGDSEYEAIEELKKVEKRLKQARRERWRVNGKALRNCSWPGCFLWEGHNGGHISSGYR